MSARRAASERLPGCKPRTPPAASLPLPAAGLHTYVLSGTFLFPQHAIQHQEELWEGMGVATGSGQP